MLWLGLELGLALALSIAITQASPNADNCISHDPLISSCNPDKQGLTC